MKLIVCPMIHAASVFERSRPSHFLGLLPPGDDEISLSETPANRLELRFNDIATLQEGLVAPDETHMRDILSFGASWTGEAPMLIHCYAGISRSTAAAFAIACQRMPDLSEKAIASMLRQASQSATPNALMVALADRLLKRQGRMIDAALSIGEGDGLFKGKFFELTSIAAA